MKALREELVAALAQSPLLKILGKGKNFGAELRQLLEHSQVFSFRKGQTILREGASSDRMYILIEGSVEVLRGRSVLATFSQVGDVFGEVGVITGAQRSATVRASLDAVCLGTDPELTRQLEEQDNILFTQAMQRALASILLQRLQSASEELVKTKESLARAQRQNTQLKKKNGELDKRVRQLTVAVGKNEFRGPRANAGKPRGKPKA